MLFIQDIGDDFLYAFGLILFIGIISLVWISTYVNYPISFLVEQETYLRNEEWISSTPTLNLNETSTEHESDTELSDIEEQSLTLSFDRQIQEEDHSLRITIKFLNETQKLISANSNDTISKIKRLYFADELSNNKIIRFIYQGRELQNSETLRTCNIRDETIIHCQITTRRHSTSNDLNSNAFDTSSFLDLSPVNISYNFIIFLTIILASIWYLRIKYRVLFTPISTIILILITILFLIFTYGPLFPTRQIHFD